MIPLVTLMDNPIRDAKAGREAQRQYLGSAVRLRIDATRELQEGKEGKAARDFRLAYLVEDAAIDEARVERGDVPLIEDQS